MGHGRAGLLKFGFLVFLVFWRSLGRRKGEMRREGLSPCKEYSKGWVAGSRGFFRAFASRWVVCGGVASLSLLGRDG